MTIRDTDQATRIAAMVEAKRRDWVSPPWSRARERNARGAGYRGEYDKGRDDMAAEILREIEAGKY